MSKEYHYVVKWSDENGWEIDSDSEETRFPDGTIYDSEQGWQFGYLGEGEYNGDEQELTDTLTDILELHNSMKGRE
jgi:hypothetical protein